MRDMWYEKLSRVLIQNHINIFKNFLVHFTINYDNKYTNHSESPVERVDCLSICSPVFSAITGQEGSRLNWQYFC